MNLKKIFGTEPALIGGVIAAAIALAVSFGLPVSNDQVGLIMAVVTVVLGAVTAYLTTGTFLSYVVAVTKAVLALAVGFGAHLSTDNTGAIIAFITVALSLYNRSNNSPEAYALAA